MGACASHTLCAGAARHSAPSGIERQIQLALKAIIAHRRGHDTDVLRSFNRIILKFPVIRRALSSVRSVFKQFDVDGSGKIDPKELSACMRSLGAHLTEKDVKRMFGFAHMSEGGALSFREFLLCLAIGSVLQLFPLLKAYSQLDLGALREQEGLGDDDEEEADGAASKAAASGPVASALKALSRGTLFSFRSRQAPSVTSSGACDGAAAPPAIGGSAVKDTLPLVPPPLEAEVESEAVSSGPPMPLGADGAHAGAGDGDPDTSHAVSASALYGRGKRLVKALKLILEAYILFDADGSGTIDRAEVLAIIDARQVGASSAATAAQEGIGSGVGGVSGADNAPVGGGGARRARPKASESNALLSRERWMELDWDGDGQITFKEFMFAFLEWAGVEDDEEEDDEETDAQMEAAAAGAPTNVADGAADGAPPAAAFLRAPSAHEAALIAQDCAVLDAGGAVSRPSPGDAPPRRLPSQNSAPPVDDDAVDELLELPKRRTSAHSDASPSESTHGHVAADAAGEADAGAASGGVPLSAASASSARGSRRTVTVATPAWNGDLAAANAAAHAPAAGTSPHAVPRLSDMTSAGPPTSQRFLGGLSSRLPPGMSAAEAVAAQDAARLQHRLQLWQEESAADAAAAKLSARSGGGAGAGTSSSGSGGSSRFIAHRFSGGTHSGGSPGAPGASAVSTPDAAVTGASPGTGGGGGGVGAVVGAATRTIVALVRRATSRGALDVSGGAGSAGGTAAAALGPTHASPAAAAAARGLARQGSESTRLVPHRGILKKAGTHGGGGGGGAAGGATSDEWHRDGHRDTASPRRHESTAAGVGDGDRCDESVVTIVSAVARSESGRRHDSRDDHCGLASSVGVDASPAESTRLAPVGAGGRIDLTPRQRAPPAGDDVPTGKAASTHDDSPAVLTSKAPAGADLRAAVPAGALQVGDSEPQAEGGFGARVDGSPATRAAPRSTSTSAVANGTALVALT